jgi:(p)ppGpp synthase/HD superfamily hydrolase
LQALLHDAIEDCEVPRELIAKSFGTEVADLVAEVTDDKTLAKERRKEMQIEMAHKKSPRAKVLKLADKTSNLRALATSPAPDWMQECAAEYPALQKLVTIDRLRLDAPQSVRVACGCV